MTSKSVFHSLNSSAAILSAMAVDVPKGVTGQSTHGFSIRAAGLSISVFGECPRTMERLDRYLLPWLVRPSVHPSSHDVILSLRTDSFGLERNGTAADFDAPEPYLFPLLQRH